MSHYSALVNHLSLSQCCLVPPQIAQDQPVRAILRWIIKVREKR